MCFSIRRMFLSALSEQMTGQRVGPIFHRSPPLINNSYSPYYMKSLLKWLPVVFVLFLAACKKDNGAASNLSISGFSAGVFASGDAISVYGTGFDANAANDVVLFDGV